MENKEISEKIKNLEEKIENMESRLKEVEEFVNNFMDVARSTIPMI